MLPWKNPNIIPDKRIAVFSPNFTVRSIMNFLNKNSSTIGAQRTIIKKFIHKLFEVAISKILFSTAVFLNILIKFATRFPNKLKIYMAEYEIVK